MNHSTTCILPFQPAQVNLREYLGGNIVTVDIRADVAASPDRQVTEWTVSLRMRYLVETNTQSELRVEGQQVPLRIVELETVGGGLWQR